MIEKLWGVIENIISFFIYRVFRINISEKDLVNLFQFIKFGLVGIVNSFISYAVYLIFICWGMHYTPANVTGFTVSVINSYYWNNKYVFVSGEKRVWWKTFLKTYVSYAGTGIILGNILLALWIEVCEIPSAVAPLINLGDRKSVV